MRIGTVGSMIEFHAAITHASAISQENIQITLTITFNNSIEMDMTNILNVFVQAPAIEKKLATLSSELGNDTKMTAVIVRSLDGLKTAGATFEII